MSVLLTSRQRGQSFYTRISREEGQAKTREKWRWEKSRPEEVGQGTGPLFLFIYLFIYLCKVFNVLFIF